MSRRAEDQGGFALLVMFGAVAAASLAVFAAVQTFVPPRAGAKARADARLVRMERAAREGFRVQGRFPDEASGLRLADASLGLLGLETGRRRGPGVALNLQSARLQVRDRSADGMLTTAIAAEPLVRARQRSRLRLIRALLTRSAFRAGAAASCGQDDDREHDRDEDEHESEHEAEHEGEREGERREGDEREHDGDRQRRASIGTGRAALLQAMRDYAIARRHYLTADVATRVELQRTMDTAAAAVAAITAASRARALPLRITGQGGLMAELGLPDARAVDGLGRTFVFDATVGVVACGSDRRGGTDDDM